MFRTPVGMNCRQDFSRINVNTEKLPIYIILHYS